LHGRQRRAGLKRSHVDTAWYPELAGRFRGLYGFNRLTQQHALAFVALPPS
jgi:hypothetical protein